MLTTSMSGEEGLPEQAATQGVGNLWVRLKDAASQSIHWGAISTKAPDISFGPSHAQSHRYAY